MFKDLRSKFMKQNEVTLGASKVQIEKVTPRKFKQLFAVIESIPNLLIQVVNAPKGQEIQYLLTACDIGMDEIVDVVSVLSGIGREELFDGEVGLDEIVEYLVKMADFNNLEKLAKNLKSLLPMNKEEETE